MILNADSYKMSHWLQYPKGTQYVSSYIEARDGGDYDKVMVFGLQAFIKEYMLAPITRADIDEASMFCAAHGVPFHKEGMDISPCRLKPSMKGQSFPQATSWYRWSTLILSVIG